MSEKRFLAGSLAVAVALTVGGCSYAPKPPTCAPATAIDLTPESGRVFFGVNLDWSDETLDEYAAALGGNPAASVVFLPMPLGETDRVNLDGAADQARAQGGALIVTLEPNEGLAAVTDKSIVELTEHLATINSSGVAVFVRFAHEMNGSWYAWGQQPELYVSTFRTVATAVHATAPGTAMMWAPNYGGGYPFIGSEFEVAAGTRDAEVLDTNGDGTVSGLDDPYAPYYPGDDAVDWVGMSLYHWGSTYPWGSNDLPEPDKFVDQLTGTYVGLGGDDSAVPDFYADYGVARNKPIAIPETAALVTESASDSVAFSIKSEWWRQILSPATITQFPQIKMVNWFEWSKHEVEVAETVDWRVAADAATLSAFLDDTASVLEFASPDPSCVLPSP